jgi:hypothetical protein
LRGNKRGEARSPAFPGFAVRPRESEDPERTSLILESLLFWIPAPCFAKAKLFWLRGGECAGMNGAGWRAKLAPLVYRLNSPMMSALASVLKCRLKPTTAAEVSALTSSFSAFTAKAVKR